jgi:hypothetical protein
MSFWVILIGILIMFVGFIYGAMALLGFLGKEIYVYGSMAIMIISGLLLAFVAIMLNGVMGPFLGAKMHGNTLLSVVTSARNIELLSGNEKQGWIKTVRGYFQIRPNSVCSWPNGVRGALAYFKYGITLEPKFIEATTKLRDAGFTNIRQVTEAAEKAKSENKELIINMDGDFVVQPKEQIETRNTS